MFKKIAKKVAITLNLFLLLQLASMGLSAGTAGATMTVPTVSLPASITTDLANPTIVKNNNSNCQEYSVTLDNTAGSDHSNVSARVEINEAVLSEIKSFQYNNGAIWVDVALTPESDDLVGTFGPNGGSMNTTYRETTKYCISFNNASGLTRDFQIVYSVYDEVAKEIVAVTSGKFISDAQAPTLTQLPSSIVIERVAKPVITVTANDETKVGDLYYRLTGTGIDTGLQTAPPVTPGMTTTWDLLKMFQDASGQPDLKNVPIGTYHLNYYTKDYAGNEMVPAAYDTDIQIVLSTPTVNPVTSPTNKIEQMITGTKEANTSLWLDDGTTQTEIVPLNSLTTWSFDVVNMVEGSNEITLFAKDAIGNVSASVTTAIVVKTIPPVEVKDLSATVVENGYVNLTWTNPVDTASYDGLRIVRTSDGNTYTINLSDKTLTNYLDTEIEKGKSYTYKIVAYDFAGNSTDSNQVSIDVPPAEVVVVPPANEVASAAISDSADQTISDNNKKFDLDKIVKSKEDKKDDEALPFWALLLLLILAGVGAYLLFVQRPAAIGAATTTTAAKPKPVKNTRPKGEK